MTAEESKVEAENDDKAIIEQLKKECDSWKSKYQTLTNEHNKVMEIILNSGLELMVFARNNKVTK